MLTGASTDEAQSRVRLIIVGVVIGVAIVTGTKYSFSVINS